MLFVYAVIVVVCALAAGGVGALWYVILPVADRAQSPRARRRQRNAMTKAAMSDTGRAMKQRFWIGAGIGGVVGVAASVLLHRKMTKRRLRN